MMKKFLLGVLSIFAVLCLVACGKVEVTLKDLTIEGQKTEFNVGDTFSTQGLKVTATYSDASTKDVTNDAKIEQNAKMNNAGSYAVIVSYGNISKAYEITVVDNITIKEINVDASGAKTKFNIGEAFTTEGLKVTAVYYDATTKDVTNDAKIEQNADMNTAGSYAVIVSYQNMVKSYNITVVDNVTVKEIDIDTTNVKKEFMIGETFTAEGLKVTATYLDASTNDVTKDVKVEQNANMNVAGSYAVLVTYQNITKGYEITVVDNKKIKDINVDTTNVKTEFNLGEAFTTEGLKVTLTYSDASTSDITKDVKIEQNVDVNTPGTYAVLVTYQNITKAYDVKVVENKTMQAIKLDINGVKTNYLVGETIDYSKVNVIEVYKNGVNVESITFGDLSKYTIKITDANNNEVSGAFNEKGTYTVTISKDNFKASYEVSVNYKSYETVADALEVGNENVDKVVSGTITYKQNGFNVTAFNYLFGKDYLEVEADGGKYYYQMLDDEEACGIFNYDGELSKTYAEEEYLEGVKISSFIYYFNNEMYGVEGLLNEIKDIADDEDIKCYNYKEEAKKCEVCGYVHSYTYSFETILSGIYYTYITVEFTLDGINGNFAEATVTLQGFRLDEMNYDEENDVYTVLEDVTEYTMNTIITAKQVSGERTSENPYKITDYLFSSFDLVDANNNVINNEVNATVKEPLLLTITNVAPSTASTTLDDFSVEVTDEDGNEVYTAYGYYNSDENAIQITSYKAGTYYATVKTTLVEKTFKLNVQYAELETFAAGIEGEWGDDEETSTATTKENMELVVKAIVNDGANPSFTAALQTETEDAEVYELGGSYIFSATKTGTYVIVLTSTVNPDKTATLEVTVEEGVKMTELLNGEYTYTTYFGFKTLSFVFTPDSEGALTGSLVISDGENTGYFTYAYDESWEALDVTPEEGSEDFEYSVEYDSLTQSLWCVVNGWSDGELERAQEVVDGELGGTYTAEYTTWTGMKEPYTFTFNADGTGTFDFSYSWYSGSFEWILNDDNTITFSNATEDNGCTIELEGSFDAENNIVEITSSLTEDGYTDTVTLEYSR